MPERKSERISIFLIAVALFGGMMFFKETIYVLTLTVLLIMIMVAYVLFNSRRKNSFKPGEKPEQENKTSPSEGVEEK